jgi:hypothetical protein
MTTISSANNSMAISSINNAAGVVGASATPPVATLLPEPGQVDIGSVVAKLSIENAFTERAAARQDRRTANAAMISAQKAQISKMREQADKNFEAARADAFGKIWSGGLGIGAGIAGGLDYKNVAVGLNGGRSIGEGVAGIVSGNTKRDADRLGAAAKAAEMEATAQKDRVETADDEIKEAREHVRTALDFLREFQSTEAKSMSSAIRG